MTTGLKQSSNYYLDLIITFPPRPISNEQELIATQNRINSILDKSNLTQDDQDYLKILGMLVYEYESKHEIIPKLEGVELLKAILEEDNLQLQDLVGIFENESVILEILENKRQISQDELDQLSKLY